MRRLYHRPAALAAGRFVCAGIRLVGVYCPETRGVYLAPLVITGARECNMRVDLPRNGQKNGVRFADRYRVA